LPSRAGRFGEAWSHDGIAGGPVVCLIGAGYVTELTGGGRGVRALVGAALLLAVMALAAGGLRASAAAQLLLVSLLLAVIVIAVAGSAGLSHASNWTPFAPHGWQAVGHAASTLMLSFVGWEAVAPLTTRFTDPARQLPRVIGSALVVTSVLYRASRSPRSASSGPARGSAPRSPRCCGTRQARPGRPPPPSRRSS
jgi:amino acid efflux transporter